MSKHNHAEVANSVSFIVRQVATLPADEIQTLYGIEFLENGKVFDPTYNQEFSSVGEWAEFCVNEDNTEHSEHFYYDDGEYD